MNKKSKIFLFLVHVFCLRSDALIMSIISLDFLVVWARTNFPIFSAEPKFVINYLQNLRSSEESLKEQVFIPRLVNITIRILAYVTYYLF